MLKKNFARGSFGEIWLGVRRPCWRDMGGKMEFLAGFNTSSTSSHRETFQAPQDSCSMLGAKIYNEEGGTSSKQWATGDLSGYADDMFILKRILVEKGASAYLSGLREKYFGQIFLNESLAARERAAKPARHHLHDPVLAHNCANFRTSFWNPFCYSKRTVVTASGNGSHPEYESGAGLAHIARYVESLEMPGKQEFWLVFHNEGQSLASLLYTAGTGGKAEDDNGELGGFKVVQPSPWWRWLKTTDAGRTEMRSIMHQLLLAVKECHDHNITHRDIKPGNMIVRAERDHVSDWPSNLTMRIIDFGSAVDRFTLKHLYGPSGTSQAEQTAEYAPPEANLGKHWMHFHPDQAYMYDLWSVGVVMLELVLGTPHVFQISTRTRALLDHRLQGMDASAREMIYLLRAFLEMCILLPGIPPQHHHHHHTETLQQSEEVRLAAWECTEEAFMQQIKQRDPLGMGMPDIWALRLVRRLLQWYPQDRISAAEALQHPFFHPSLQDDPRKL
jgi:serine/threonine protein kinase